MKEKKYTGYQSFQYLTPGQDYKSYRFDLGRVSRPSLSLDLTREQEERVRQLIISQHIVSLRDHGFIIPADKNEILPYCREYHTFYHYEGLAHSGIDILFDNFMDGVAMLTSKTGLKWDDCLLNLGMRYCDLEQQDMVFIARHYAELKEAKRRGKIAIIASLEAATALENELDRVDVLYGFGIRCLGITYNDANTLGCGLSEERDSGLTRFGQRVIERMNKLGMLIDISHCGEQTSLDVINSSRDPVLITHAGARKVWDSARMKSDEVLTACAQKGGVIGICAAPNTTLSRKMKTQTIEAVMEHFEYIVDLVGIDHVALGPDTMYGDHLALQQAFDQQLSLSLSHAGADHKEEEMESVLGMENPSEAMINAVRWLVKHGYSNTEIKKVIGTNALRVLKEVLS